MKITRYNYKKEWLTVLPFILFTGILALAAYLRFINLTHEGMDGCDTFGYWIMGKLWAEGNYIFNDGVQGEFFRPVAYYLHSIAFQLFGLNDYAIKLLHASMDMFNIVLVCAIGAIMGRSLWMGVSSGILYAFLPSVIGYSRQELVHIPSATFVLLSILFYVLFDNIQKRKIALGLVFLALSGVSLSLAAGIHTDLAMLGVCFIPLILLSTFSKQEKARSLGKFVLYSLVFSVSVFSLFIASGWLIGFERLISLLRPPPATTVAMAPLEQTFFLLTKGMKQVTTSPAMAWLFLGTPVLMIILWIRKSKMDIIAFLPWVFWLGYGLLFELLMGGSEYGNLFHRLLIPLAPLVAIGIVYWYTKTLEMITGRKWIANLVMLFGCIVLAWFNFAPHRSSLALHQAHYQSRFRGVYDVLKDKMGDNKLLVAPYLEYAQRRGLQQDMYLGNKALCIIDFQDPSKSLDDIVKENNIKYIYVGGDADTRMLKQPTFQKHDLNDPHKYENAPLILGACYGMNSGSYSLERELKILDQFISAHHGRLLWQGRNGALYEIDRIAKGEAETGI